MCWAVGVVGSGCTAAGQVVNKWQQQMYIDIIRPVLELIQCRFEQFESNWIAGSKLELIVVAANRFVEVGHQLFAGGRVVDGSFFASAETAVYLHSN